jgi:hypothetical protein
VIGQVVSEHFDVLFVALVKLFPESSAFFATLRVVLVEVFVTPNGVHQFRKLLDEVVM